MRRLCFLGDSMEEYKTILTPADVEFVERRSRFIGHIRPVSSEEEALAFLSEMRSQYWDATHNVYAYRLRQSGAQRYSDDGEPQGTAGMPTLDVLRKSGVTDVAAVVTRYFGGILLLLGGKLIETVPSRQYTDRISFKGEVPHAADENRFL